MAIGLIVMLGGISATSARTQQSRSTVAARAASLNAPPLTVDHLRGSVVAGDRLDFGTLGVVELGGLEGTVIRVPYASDDRTVVSGVIDAPADGRSAGTFVIARRGSHLVGHVRTTAHDVWRLAASPATSGAITATRQVPPNEPDCAMPGRPAMGVESHGADCAHCSVHAGRLGLAHARDAGDGRVSDVLVVYTETIESLAGGPEPAAAAIDVVVEETNVAFIDSGIDAAVRLRAVHRFTGEEPTLEELRAMDDGVYDEVHVLRDGYAADLVVQIVEGGIGSALGLDSFDEDEDQNAFCNVGVASVPFLNFTHEIGHNMGACHAVGDGGGCGVGLLFEYSNGHRWDGASGQQWRSVMAYSPGGRTAQFSNPDISFDGRPTGVAPGDGVFGADNAATINASAAFVARHRSSASGACADLPIDPDAPDCNGNNIPDPCEVLLGLADDVNGNGVPDECDACIGDVDGNDAVDTGDILGILAAWGPCPMGACAADIDGSGAVNVSDLLAVLAAWGPCR